MARKAKIPNHIKKRRDRKETVRKIENKTKRKYFLIVCEGEKTEPNYFESIKKALPRGVLQVCDITIIGTGFNTKSLVQEAMKLRTKLEKQREQPIDKLWVVFDRDSFQPQDFNAAIQSCLGTPSLDAAWSNEAFELWYLLHFHYYNTAISRKDYQGLIEGNFKSKGLKDYEYKKNSLEMFDLLEKHGSREDAIRNAAKLEMTYPTQSFANQNPCTKVHKLVIELFNLA